MSGTNLQERFTEWATKMGYSGNLPKDLDGLITPKTAHVWEQLLVKIQPKKHCRVVRDNILVNRLKSDGKITPYNYPIDEIEVYDKKERLCVQLSAIKCRISKNDVKIRMLADETKMQGLTLGGLHKRIGQHEREALVLNAKSDELRMEMVEIEEVISLAKRLTPVEPSDYTNCAQVEDDLKRCVEKLEAFVRKKAKRRDKDRSRTVSPSVTFRSSFVSLADTSFPDITISDPDVNGPPEQLDDLVKNVLYRHDRLTIMHCLQDSFEKSVAALACGDFFDGPPKSERSVYFTELYGVHVKNELEARRLDLDIDRLTGEMHKLLQIACSNATEKTKTHLLLQVKMAEAKTIEAYIKKQLEAVQNSTAITSESDLLCAQAKSDEIQQQIYERNDSIGAKMDEIKEHHQNITGARTKMKNTARKLCAQLDDLSWCDVLLCELFQKEVQLFRSHSTSCSHLTELDTPDLYMYSKILGNPYTPQEITFINLLRDKTNLHHFSSLLRKKQSPTSTKYSPGDLTKSETYLERTVGELQDLYYCARQKTDTMTTDRMNHIVRLWLEMPFRRYVSPERLVCDRDYHHYDKIFNGYLNML